MKMFKLAAKACGYSFGYDKTVRAYKFEKGSSVFHFSKHELLYMGCAKLLAKLSTADVE